MAIEVAEPSSGASAASLGQGQTLLDPKEANEISAISGSKETAETSVAPVVCSKQIIWRPTEAEWLALFPSKPDGRSPSERHLSGFGDASESDPAAELRRIWPTTREVLNRELARIPALRFAIFAEFFAGTLSRQAGSAFSLASSFYLAMNGPAYVFNDGRFQTGDLITGTISEAFVIIAGGLPKLLPRDGACL